jgi:ParB-like chromosome segregation protein Spo0J
MRKSINRVKEMEVATVQGNKTLATGLEHRAVERCKDAIGRLGVLHTPVIGATKEGKRMLLSGQCELVALRELGVRKMDAVEVDMPSEDGAAATMALLLTSLRAGPGALCESMLLQDAVGSGVPRSEIQAMLGKSASWVCNRLALATRLDGGVYEMVRGGLLDARSAQEVARLPADVQFAFAENAVREGLPKSAIESLVAGYNDSSCPDTVKAQMIADPRAALGRMMDKRRAVFAGHPDGAQARDIEGRIHAAQSHMAILRRMLSSVSPTDASGYADALMGLHSELSALLASIQGLVSPGKKEADQHDG